MLRRFFRLSNTKSSSKHSQPASSLPPNMSMNFDPAGLRELSKLVNDSVETIIAEYGKVNATVPTLDDIEPGPFDPTEKPTFALKDAVKVLRGACSQLSLTCSAPTLSMATVRTNSAKCTLR